MSVQSPHMDLAEMIAEINAETAAGQARGHLAACAECRTEADRWAAVADAVGFLAASIRVPTGAIPETAPAVRPGRRRPGRRMVIAVASAAAVVAAVLAVVVPGHSRLTGPLHTAWQAASALPQRAVTGTRGAAGAWRLASYLITGWQRTDEGVSPGYLTCPVAGICYVIGNSTTSPSGIPDLNTLFVSTTGGISWSTVPVPSGLSFTTPLSCGSAAECAAGGVYFGQPVFADTADGGHSWTLDPLPGAANGLIDQLSCPTTSTCNGLLQAGWGQVTFLRTTDAGRRFVNSEFPAGQVMQTLSCPTATDCVAIGLPSADFRYDAHLRLGGFVEISTDGGATWTPGRMPRGLGPGLSPSVDCPDARHCFAIAATNVLAQNAFAASADGGLTWTQRQLPRDVPGPDLDDLSCPTSSSCYVDGSEDIPQWFADGSVNESSAMLLATSNGGENWSRVTFAVPAKVPAGWDTDAYMDIGTIQCPRAGVCIGLGVTDQGSMSAPVYTLGSAP
jgi:photosystem II stability/assembly factor-like uncharacterized protein